MWDTTWSTGSPNKSVPLSGLRCCYGAVTSTVWISALKLVITVSQSAPSNRFTIFFYSPTGFVDGKTIILKVKLTVHVYWQLLRILCQFQGFSRSRTGTEDWWHRQDQPPCVAVLCVTCHSKSTAHTAGHSLSVIRQAQVGSVRYVRRLPRHCRLIALGANVGRRRSEAAPEQERLERRCEVKRPDGKMCSWQQQQCDEVEPLTHKSYVGGISFWNLMQCLCLMMFYFEKNHPSTMRLYFQSAVKADTGRFLGQRRAAVLPDFTISGFRVAYQHFWRSHTSKYPFSKNMLNNMLHCHIDRQPTNTSPRLLCTSWAE